MNETIYDKQTAMKSFQTIFEKTRKEPILIHSKQKLLKVMFFR